MKWSFLLLLIITVTLVIVYTQSETLFNPKSESESSESFDTTKNTLIIKNDSGEIIREINLDPSIPSYIYQDEINNLLKLKTKLILIVPPEYIVRIIYKDIDTGAKSIELSEGIHNINSFDDNKKINKIEILNNNYDGINIIDKNNEILYTFGNENEIDWDIIYSYYGLEDYYIGYPWGRSIYYYNTYPRYRYYQPRYHHKPYLHSILRPGKIYLNNNKLHNKIHPTKLPNRVHPTKLPNRVHQTKLHNKIHPTNLPNRVHQTKLHNKIHPTNLPNRVHTNLPNRVHTNLPNRVHPTNLPNRVHTNLPNRVHPTNLPNRVHPTNLPNRVHTNLPNRIRRKILE